MIRQYKHASGHLIPLAMTGLAFGLLLLLPSIALASALGDLAASMAPGTWAQFTTNNIQPTLMGTQGSTGSILSYSESLSWDSVNHIAYFAGNDHGFWTDARLVRYVESTNTWDIINVARPPDGVIAHSYDSQTWSPISQCVYYKAYFGTALYRWCLSNPVWVQMASIPTSQSQGSTAPLVYFPDLGALVSVYYDTVWKYVEATNTWTQIAGAPPLHSGDDIERWMEYNPIYHAVYFGGGAYAEANTIYRMDSSGTVTRRNDNPRAYTDGHDATVTDPVTGDMIFGFDDRTWYQYNPSTQVWTQLTGARVPPNGIYASNPPSEGPLALVISVPISNYGVTFWVSCDGGGGGACRTFLYKHGTSVSDLTPPSNPTNLTANGVASSQVDLTWTASTDNVGVTGYRIERCQSTGCTNFTQIASPTGTSYSDTSPTAATTYSYRIRATDAAGNLSNYSSIVSATTTGGAIPPPPSDTTSPSIPSNLTTTIMSSSQINLSWTASTDNIGVTGYRIERCQSAGCTNFTQIASPTGTSYSDTSLTATTTYSYRIRATDAAGNFSGYSSVASATTQSPSSPPSVPSSLGGLTIPSLADEKATYQKWGWTWNTNQESTFVTELISNYTISNPDIHYDTEGDDLWSYLMMYRRTGNPVYLNRANAWASYFKNGYRSCSGDSNQNYCFDLNAFNLDHMYGWGLVSLYEHNGDSAALTEAQNLGAVIETLDAGKSPGYDLAYFGLRQYGRHLLLAARLAEATGLQRWKNLRDYYVNLWLNSPGWDSKYGMYFISEEGMGYAGYTNPSYAQGLRIQSAFQIGILVEAFWAVYRTTGNTAIRDRLIAMANYINVYGIDDVTTHYTGSWFGQYNGVPWHSYKESGATFCDPVYTTSLVNTLVIGYKLSGNSALLDRAKYFFNRGTKGVYGSCTQRVAADNVVHHFVDTIFDNSTLNYYLQYNKGELRYTSLIFENGGAPTLDSGSAGSTPPAPPTNLTLQ